jgi:hypothetical protein
MPARLPDLSVEVEIDGSFIFLAFHQPKRPVNTQVCFLKNRIGKLILKHDFSERPSWLLRLPSRILLGINGLQPLLQVKELEHPKATISFYQGEARDGRCMKFAWITSSQRMGSLFLPVADQDYDSILDRLSATAETPASGDLKERAARADLEEFDRILDAVPDVEPDPKDR